MSKLLSQARSGVELGPQTWLLAGPPKKGKSSLAAQFPKPIFADIDDGTKNLDVNRLDKKAIPDYETLLSFYDELLAAKASEFKTVVTDSSTILQQYMVADVCKRGNKKTLGEFPHGDGYERLKKASGDFIAKQKELKEAGYHVVLVGHTKIKNFSDPIINAEYSRHILDCDDRLAAALKAGFDNLLFINSEVTAYEDKNKMRATSDGESYIFTTHSHAYDAGNRLNLPPKLPLSFSAINKAFKEYKPLAEVLRTEIDDLCSKGEASRVEAARTALIAAGNDIYELGRIRDKLKTIVAVVNA